MSKTREYDERTDKFDTVIWWVNQSVYHALPSLPETFPKYLREQYRFREGRPGRCRLWSDPEIFRDFEVNPWPKNAFTTWLEQEDYGGILARYEDFHEFLAWLPGVFTRHDMTRDAI